ncbi:MAG: HAMP domain-containing protein [Anaerolineae bacterium]|nr:HAMP domain-containing protein [Anaerolineae bacterium]
MTESKEKKQHVFISLRFKILLGFTLLFSIVFALAFYWFYTFATQQAMYQIQADLTNTLNAAIVGLDGDEFDALAREGEPNAEGFSDDPRYWNQLDWLDTVHNIEPRAFLYTYVKGTNTNEVLFINDSTVKNNPYPDRTPPKFLESYISAGAMLESFAAPVTLEEPYIDKWGSWVSAYAPITNSDGEKVGAMGVDFLADYVKEVQQAIINNILMAFGVTYLVLFLMVFLMSNTLTQPVITLTKAAEQVAEGNYEQNISILHEGRLRDEVATMAEVFEMMIGKIYAREQSLKSEVRKLRIEIDEAKKQRHVEEITESEYFRSLQATAKKMREQVQDREQEE